jgi:LDH2 family malate/lactate/ureidoglycolate dehydrogenase
MQLYTASQLRVLTKEILVAKGAPEKIAETVANLLVRANLAGHDSHGVLRIPAYVRSIENGELDPRAEGVLEIDFNAMGVFDGQGGFGQVIATNAMRIAIEKAKRYGVAAISTYRCGHIGRMADYCMMASTENMISITAANSDPIMTAFAGIERIFNPSPLGAAFPTTNQDRPFVLDIGMGMSVEGKILVKKARGEKLSQGEIIDKHGRPSIEPTDFIDGGSILPFGGTLAYKSYGLAFLIDVLSGALGGNGCASSKDFLGGNGVFMIVIDISKFTDLELFRKRVGEVIGKIKASRIAPGHQQILIPGEPEFLSENSKQEGGILIDDSTIGEISELTTRLKVKMPDPIVSEYQDSV